MDEPVGGSSTKRRASRRGEGYRYGSNYVLPGYSDGRPRDDTDDEPSSPRFGSGFRGGAGSDAEEDDAALERQRGTYSRFHHEETARGFPCFPRTIYGPCTFLVSPGGDIKLHYVKCPEVDKSFDNISYVAEKLHQSPEYVKQHILMDHKEEGRDELELVSTLRFERRGMFNDERSRYTSFCCEWGLGFPTPWQADALAYEKFTREISSEIPAAPVAQVTETSQPTTATHLLRGGCATQISPASSTSSTFTFTFSPTPRMREADAKFGPRGYFVVSSCGDIQLVCIDTSILAEYLGNVKFVAENTGMSEEMARERLGWGQPAIGTARCRFKGRSLFVGREDELYSFGRRPWNGYPEVKEPTPMVKDWVRPSEVEDVEAQRVKTPEQFGDCKPGCKGKHQRFEKCRVEKEKTRRLSE